MAGAFIMPSQHIQAEYNTVSVPITMLSFAAAGLISCAIDAAIYDKNKHYDSAEKTFKSTLRRALIAGASCALTMGGLLVLAETGDVIIPKLAEALGKKVDTLMS